MSRLPSGYQELEYIQSTGTQYIDTGISANVDTNSYQIKFTDFVYSSTSSVFGSSDNWCDTLSYYNNTLRYCLTSSALTTGSIFGSSNYAGGTFTVSKNGVINDSGYTFTSTSDNNSYGGNILAFSGKGKASVKIHFFKIFVNDILVRNLIPSKRTSDSAIGMYDLVSQTFFGNAGTGSFIAGVPVIEPTWGSGLASVNKSAIIRRRGLIGSDDGKLWLYKDGDECTDVTGGWAGIWPSTTQKNPTNISYDFVYRNHSGGCRTLNKINLTEYEYIKFELYASVDTSQSTEGCGCGSTVGLWDGWVVRTAINAGRSIYTVNISGLSGSYYVGLTQGLTGTGNMYRCWLE